MTRAEILAKAERLVELLSTFPHEWSKDDRMEWPSLLDDDNFHCGMARLLLELAAELKEREWREISAAPKDGTAILATCGPPFTRPSITHWGLCPLANRYGWLEDNGPDSDDAIQLREPFRYWQPLPHPPEGK